MKDDWSAWSKYLLPRTRRSLSGTDASLGQRLVTSAGLVSLEYAQEESVASVCSERLIGCLHSTELTCYDGSLHYWCVGDEKSLGKDFHWIGMKEGGWGGGGWVGVGMVWIGGGGGRQRPHCVKLHGGNCVPELA